MGGESFLSTKRSVPKQSAMLCCGFAWSEYRFVTAGNSFAKCRQIRASRPLPFPTRRVVPCCCESMSSGTLPDISGAELQTKIKITVWLGMQPTGNQNVPERETGSLAKRRRIAGMPASAIPIKPSVPGSGTDSRTENSEVPEKTDAQHWQSQGIAYMKSLKWPARNIQVSCVVSKPIAQKPPLQSLPTPSSVSWPAVK